MRALLPLLALARPAAGHVPAVLEGELRVEDPTISQALYGCFETGREIYVVTLPMPRDFALPFELLVPHRASLREHRPRYAVAGPGLPLPTPDEAAALPWDLPAGWGAMVELDDATERAVIFEGFSRRVMWTTEPIALALAEGEHEVWIWSPEGTTGDFVLGFGVEEDFSGVDWGDMLSDWPSYGW